MARRLPQHALTLCLGLALACTSTASHAAPSVPLLSYSFDDSLIETGPDTFQVFEQAKGKVKLSRQFPYSGTHSVQIQDVAYDGTFPELQGYFPVRKTGHELFHFVFMVSNPEQGLNIALAGPEHFSMRRNGIGFWLSLKDGHLFHTTDSIPKPLFDIQPFVWYEVDMNYDIKAGRYDLRITDAGNPVVDIKNAANTTNQPDSVLSKFSFIGDLHEDVSTVNYFVDDIWLSSDTGTKPSPFVAPGRRKLFIDYWDMHQKYLQTKLHCLPVSQPEDFGLSQDWLRANLSAEQQRVFWQFLSGKTVSVTLPSAVHEWQTGIEAWQKGCGFLNAGKADKALALFDTARLSLSNAPLLELSRLQALSALKRWQEVDAALPSAALLWASSDLRFDVATAQIAWSRGEFPKLDMWWNAQTLPEQDFTAFATTYFGADFNKEKLAIMLENKQQSPLLQQYVIAEQYFLSLLWQKQFRPAMDYAERMARHFDKLTQAKAVWLERLGDAAFLGGLHQDAAQAYHTSSALNARLSGPLEKLADLAYLSGNAQQERRYREAVYGTLRN